MTITLVIVAILAILTAFIVASRFSAQKKQERSNFLKAKRMLLLTEETWEVVEQASKIIKAPDIISALADYYIHQVRMREAVHAQDNTDDLIASATAYKAKTAQLKVASKLETDREISLAKKTCAKASKILRVAATKNILTNDNCKVMRKALRRRLLDLEVDFHELKGDNAGEKSNPAVANNHYKFAKKILIESDLTYDGKTDRIKAITEKAQALFGNTLANTLEQETAEGESDVDKFGMPKDLDVMSGNKKMKF